MDILPFDESYVAGVGALCEALGWPSFTDPDVCRRALTAPGVVARVAVAGGTGGEVVGFGYAMGDGVLQSYLAQLAVAEPYRRQGVARRLVEEIYDATGTDRMDLVTEDAQAFYRSFPSKELPGFRIYPRWEG